MPTAHVRSAGPVGSPESDQETDRKARIAAIFFFTALGLGLIYLMIYPLID